MYVRFFMKAFKAGLDDSLLCVAVFIWFIQTILITLYNGLAWPPGTADDLGPEDGIRLNVYGFVINLLHITIVWILKLSMLKLYERLMAGLFMKKYIKAGYIIIFVSWVMVTIVNAFPFRSFTHGSMLDRTQYTQAQVIHYHITIYTLGALDNLTWVMLVIFPFPLIRRLNLHPRDKLALSIVFSFGILGLASAMARWLAIALRPETNAYILWETIEQACLVIVQSMMILGPLYDKLLCLLKLKLVVRERPSTAMMLTTPAYVDDPDQKRMKLERLRQRYARESAQQEEDWELADHDTRKRDTDGYDQDTYSSANDSVNHDSDVKTGSASQPYEEIVLPESRPGPRPGLYTSRSFGATTRGQGASQQQQESNTMIDNPWSAIHVEQTFSHAYHAKSKSDVLAFNKTEISAGHHHHHPPHPHHRPATPKEQQQATPPVPALPPSTAETGRPVLDLKTSRSDLKTKTSM